MVLTNSCNLLDGTHFWGHMSITLFIIYMHYYKKSDISKLYGVNPRTVARWIESTKAGRLDLTLSTENGRAFIAKTAKNQRIMSALSGKRRKYLNKRTLKVVKPKEEFFKIYTEEQILEIINSIESNFEIDLKFAYFNKGAHQWDAYAKQLYNENAPNTMTSNIKLLEISIPYLDNLLKDVKKVNLIDVGVGNALQTKGLITYLHKSNKLQRYAAVDISSSMLQIAENNIKSWFNNKVSFEGYVNDISFEIFADVSAEPPGGATNLVLLLGGTLANFNAPEDALKVIRKSMTKTDIFIYSLKLDSLETRDQMSTLDEDSALTEYTLSLLGIDSTLYSIEMGYDEQKRIRYRQIRLKQAVTIEVELSRGTWYLELNKADSIIVWRALHNSQFEIEKLFYDNGFNPLQKSLTPDHNYMLLISDLRKRGRES